MSGGSFEYLFIKITDEEEVFGYSALHNLQAMADDAASEGMADFADALNDLVAEIRIARSRVLVRGRRLEQAVHAFEWWRSNDYGREQAEEEIAKIGVPEVQEGKSVHGEAPLDQISRLARFIMEEVPGEPSQDGGAVDTAIRLMREWLPIPSSQDNDT